MTCGVSTTLQWFSLVFFNQWDESPIFSHKRLRFSDLSDRLHLPSQSWAVSQLRPCRVFPGVVEEVRSELDSYHGRHSSHWIPHDGGETHRHPSGQHGGLRRHRSSWNFMKRWRDLWGFGILCWLVVWNMNFMFPYIGNNTPNWRTHIFRGVGIPPTSLCIYNYRGEAGVSPEDVGTFSLPLIDICIFGRSCIQMGEGGGLLTFIALRHQKMLLRSRCCYVEDAVTLKMLLRPRCCYVEDDVTLRMLLRSRCCYVEDVVMFKMFFLRWYAWSSLGRRVRGWEVEDTGILYRHVLAYIYRLEI